jgi:hypothetical protein
MDDSTAGAAGAGIAGMFVAFVLVIIWIVVLVLAIGMYGLPSIIAIVRKKRDMGGIIAVNILLGWSILGWVAALVWALTTDTVQTVYVTQHVGYAIPPGPMPPAAVAPPPPAPEPMRNVTSTSIAPTSEQQPPQR